MVLRGLRFLMSEVPLWDPIEIFKSFIEIECSGTGYHRGTSLTGKRHPLGPYRRPMPRALGGSWGVASARSRTYMSERDFFIDNLPV